MKTNELTTKILVKMILGGVYKRKYLFLVAIISSSLIGWSYSTKSTEVWESTVQVSPPSEIDFARTSDEMAKFNKYYSVNNNINNYKVIDMFDRFSRPRFVRRMFEAQILDEGNILEYIESLERNEYQELHSFDLKYLVKTLKIESALDDDTIVISWVGHNPQASLELINKYLIFSHEKYKQHMKKMMFNTSKIKIDSLLIEKDIELDSIKYSMESHLNNLLLSQSINNKHGINSNIESSRLGLEIENSKREIRYLNSHPENYLKLSPELLKITNSIAQIEKLKEFEPPIFTIINSGEYQPKSELISPWTKSIIILSILIGILLVAMIILIDNIIVRKKQ